MLYWVKKIFFFLFSVFSILILFAWMLYDLDAAFPIYSKLGVDLSIDFLFRGDAILLPIFLALLFPVLGALLSLIFYRRECSVWPKLLLLCAGAVSAFAAAPAEGAIFEAMFRYGSPALWWKAVLAVFAAINLACIIWLIVAMEKYPRKTPKAA
ncbi:MAG TPA: hypothetical protein IAD07_08205 [Candidatus Fimivicinus intestinavium]|nr:hypothetical protein [Candidatus Fimivicinus intestinavium]